jgi:MFS transporter, ACS family, allantoate permease
MCGTAQIVVSFIAFGALHINTPGLKPWQWLYIITGLITLITAICYWSVLTIYPLLSSLKTDFPRIFFPDSPTNAWFLTKEERAIAVSRLKANQAGVENKHFKKEQSVFLIGNKSLFRYLSVIRMIECLLEPKTWVFVLFSCLANIPNSLTNQTQLIIESFGFTTFQTTLLGCVSG